MGDLGILASLLIKSQRKKYKLGILPHYVDRDHALVGQLSSQKNVRIIDATWPVKKVLKEIARCEAVASSSLHGLIVSDSLSVPNAHLKLSDKLKGGEYKFKDYYSIYDKDRYRPLTASNYDNADDLRKTIIESYEVIDEAFINDLKAKLVKSFPL